MEKVPVKKKGGDDLPRVLVSRNGKEILRDPEANTVRGLVVEEKKDPVHHEKANRGPWEISQG